VSTRRAIPGDIGAPPASGTLRGVTTHSSGGILAPGNSPGTLPFTNSLTLATASILIFELGTTRDLICVTGGLLTGPATLGGVTPNLAHSGGFATGTYALLNYATASRTQNFSAASFALGTSIAGNDYSVTPDENSLQLVATVSAIPEPSTDAAPSCALAFALTLHRKRRTSPSPAARKRGRRRSSSFLFAYSYPFSRSPQPPPPTPTAPPV
jgi:hypothetical protein